GVGKTTSQEILKEAGVSEDTRVRDLTEAELGNIRQATENFTIEGNDRRKVSMYINRLTEIDSNLRIIHSRRLTVRGQKTKNNSRTRKGPRHAVAGKKD